MKERRKFKREFTTVSIPTKLFKKVEAHISNTGFPSVSSYVAFVLRTLLAEEKEHGNAGADYETNLIKKRLENLGYF
ncbi:MAG: hypothetical protein QXR58_02415 [Candidatus Micrarchaeaceae archaeon]